MGGKGFIPDCLGSRILVKHGNLMVEKKKAVLKILCVTGILFIVYVLILNLILKPFVYKQKPHPPDIFATVPDRSQSNRSL